MTRYLFNTRRSAAHIGAAELPPDQEEFYERLGSDADVELEPGYNQDLIFDDQFERRAHEKERTPSGASAISVVPTKRGPWSGNNQLGIEREFLPDENNRQTILRLDEWGFPEIWTLCLGLIFDADLYGSSGTLSGPFSVVAEVEFGCGGVIQYLEMDWIQGACIALPMNALNVVASFGTVPTEAGTPDLPADLRLRSNIVRGTLQQAHPTRTYRLGDGNDQVPVPPFAKSVRVVAAGSAFDFYTAIQSIAFQGTAFGPTVVNHSRSQFVSWVDFTNGLVGPPAWVDVPEGARFLSLPSAGSSTLIQYRLGV